MTNDNYETFIHQIHVRPDTTEYVRIRDVNGNWIEVTITPDNEEEYRNPNHRFAQVQMRRPGRRKRKHPPRRDIVDQIKVKQWGRKYLDVRARLNWDETVPPRIGEFRLWTPSFEYYRRYFKNRFPNLSTNQIRNLADRARVDYAKMELRRFKRKNDPREKRVMRKRPELPEEIEDL